MCDASPRADWATPIVATLSDFEGTEGYAAATPPPAPDAAAAFAELKQRYHSVHPNLLAVFEELSDDEVLSALPALREFGTLMPGDFGPMMAWAVSAPEPGALVAGEDGLAFCPNSAPQDALLWAPGMLAAYRVVAGVLELDVDDGGMEMKTVEFTLVEDEVDMLADLIDLMMDNRGRRKLRRAFAEWLDAVDEDDADPSS